MRTLVKLYNPPELSDVFFNQTLTLIKLLISKKTFYSRNYYVLHIRFDVFHKN